MGKDKDKHDKDKKHKHHSDDDDDAERRAKKEAKKAKRAAEEREQKELYFGFTNDANPYNDPTLTSAFVWKKKVEILKEKGDPTADLHESKKYQQEARRKRHDEIKAVKERREAREREKEQMEALREQMDRDAMLADEDEYHRKDEEFFLNQAVEKARIRIEAGRERPIDIIAKNLHLFHATVAPDANLPVGTGLCGWHCPRRLLSLTLLVWLSGLVVDCVVVALRSARRGASGALQHH